MLRTNVLTKLTRNLQCCCNRTCIPLCKPLCESPTTPINRNLLQWQLWRQHMPPPKSAKTKLRCADPQPYMKFMPTYTMDELKRRERQETLLSCYAQPPSKPNRISSDLLTVLDRYAADPHIRFKADPLHVEAGPMAAYLHGVMEAGGALNRIYNIDFYDNNEPSYAALQRALEQQLNPFAIGSLFASLRADVPLTPEQMQQLMDFLLAASHMSPEQLDAYLKQLIALGLLTPDALFHLQKLLAENPHLRNALGAAQLDMLTKALNKAADEVAIMIAQQKLREAEQRALEEAMLNEALANRHGVLPPPTSTASRRALAKKDEEKPPEEETKGKAKVKPHPSTVKPPPPPPVKQPQQPAGKPATTAKKSKSRGGSSGTVEPIRRIARGDEDYVTSIIFNLIPSKRRWPIIRQQPTDKKGKQKQKQNV